MKLSIAVAALAGALFLLPSGASANPAAGLVAAKATSVTSGVTEVQSRRRWRRSRTEVIQTAPSGIDPTTLALILGGGALTGGGNMMSLALPLLLAQPQQETVIVERRGRRR